MEPILSPHGDGFRDFLARLPAGMDLDQLAREQGAIERERQISCGADLLRLALARGPGGLSLRDAAGWATAIGLAKISNPGVKYRLDKSVDFLAAVMHGLLAARAPGANLVWPGRSLRLADGTCVSRPGSTGTDWRVHGVFDLGAGGFSHLEVTDGKGAESILRGAAAAGEVRIADRYYCRAGTLEEFVQNSPGQSADFIVRVRWNALKLSRPDGGAFDLIQHLKALPDDAAAHACEVQAAVSGRGSVLKLRLVILRKRPEAAEATIEKMLAKARKRRQEVDPRSLVAARFMILATSLPAIGYPPEEILSAYRLRWQIELAFKRLKSLLHIDKLPTLTERASRSWLYTHLILALMCDDLSQEVLESFP